MTVTVKHSKTNAISDWTQAQLDEQIALGNFAEGTVLADIVLPSDWNNDHTLTGVGTMAEQDANNVAITGGSINGTTIGATTASTGKFTSVTTPSVTATTDNLTLSAISTGAVKFNTLNGEQLRVIDNGSAASRYLVASGSSSSSNPNLGASAGPLVLYGGATQGILFYSNAYAQQQFAITHTASAVNYVQVTGAATGVAPVISAQGSDANVQLNLIGKGNGQVVSRSWFTAAQASSNHWQMAGAGTGTTPIISTLGSDTNIPITFQPKGTGAINLAAGSSGVNISNGGTVTAITRTAAGSGYTSVPSVAITAPTTAGGVQATATAQVVINGVTSIANGGTGYTVGDVLTVSGGTAPSQTTQLTVSTVSAGVITAVTITRFGTYTVTPSNPASVTGGTGSGATFNLNYAVQSGTFTITNAGSGYIEQPTVTFSGGGGSGAAAYASVGSGTTVKTLGSSISFNVPSSEVLRLSDGSSAACYLNLQSSSTTIQGFASSSGSNVGYQWVTKGVSNHSFATNNSVSTEQFRVSHTASAVNYVQVTGSATGARPTISAQGSDANISLGYDAKGTGGHTFRAGGNTQVLINNTSTAVNALNLTGSATGTAVPISVTGTDTNIDLSLTPKGTGVLRFGTYTANMALTVQGYIEIKDSGGTLRKLAVIA